MLKIKILIIGLVSIFLFNGCARHHITPVDVVVTGVVGALILNPFCRIGPSYHGHHNSRYYRRPHFRH